MWYDGIKIRIQDRQEIKMKAEQWQSRVDTVNSEIILETEDGTYLTLMVGEERRKQLVHLTRRQVLQLQGALEAWIRETWE